MQLLKVSVLSFGCILALVSICFAQLASDRISFPQALSGRYEPREDLPEWMRVPRWCTTDGPRVEPGRMREYIEGHAQRNANILRLGTFWGGLAMYHSDFAPRQGNIREDHDPLAEAMDTVREHDMHILAYINPNAWRSHNPNYESAVLRTEDGEIWDIAAYGIENTRYACSNHPVFAEFYRRAITEVLQKYDVDGIYVDGLTPHVCYCEHCRRKFREDTGRDLPSGLTALGPQAVLWEMTSDWDIIGDVRNPDHVLFSRWMMKCLADITRLFAETAREAKPGAVVVFHTWPKPDIMQYYDGTLNEIYARKPWNFTLWKRAEFSNWGDVFAVPSLVNIYLWQHAWGKEQRPVESEVEARHMYWQSLANGAYPNSWNYIGMERPFAVMRDHAEYFDFPTTFPTRFAALPRALFTDARHVGVGRNNLIPLQAGSRGRLRILEREPQGKIDILCLRADGRRPTDDEVRAFIRGEHQSDVIFINAADFDPQTSVLEANARRWTVNEDPEALSGRHIVSSGHSIADDPVLPLEYPLPELTSSGPWQLWGRVVFPDVSSDSFFWQVSNDGGETWLPEEPIDACAVGWQQPQTYDWVEARVDVTSPTGAQVDRFLSPGAGMYAGLVHAGLPVKLLHSNHITAVGIEDFEVLILANEVSLSDDQCAFIREFVRRGGGLVATGETSLYDHEGRRRADFGLADVFGVSLRGELQPAERRIVGVGDGALAGALGAEGLPHREEHLVIEPRGASVAAQLTGPEVPGGSVPALTVHEFGAGRVVYMPGRADSSYSLWGDAGFSALAARMLELAAPAGIPARVTSHSGMIGLTSFDQPQKNRRVLHLVAYNADWGEPFDTLPAIADVVVTLTPPAGREIASVRAVLAGIDLQVHDGPDGPQVTLPQLDEYEILAVTWQ